MTEPTVKLRPISEFLDAARRNEIQIIAQHPHIYALLDEIHQSFERLLSGLHGEQEIPGFLSVAAHSYFLSGVRVALGGQMTQAYPVLRAGIESVLFALLMKFDKSKIALWAQREASVDARKACRKIFTAEEGFKVLVQVDQNLHETMQNYYKLFIAAGAHPNVNAILPHLNVEDAGTHWLAKIRYIYPSDSLAVFDTLKNTVGTGTCILAAMYHVMPEHPLAEVVFDAAQRINGLMTALDKSNRTDRVQGHI